MSESYIEQQACRELERKGCECIKVLQRLGWPDRFIVYAPRQHFWIEFKQPGKYPTPLQKAIHSKLRNKGESVYVCRSKREALEALAKEKAAFRRAGERCSRDKKT